MDNNKLLEGYKAEGEEILKKVKPKASTRLMGQIIMLVLIALICLAGDCFFVGVSMAIGIADGKKIWMVVIFVFLLIIHIVPEIFWLMNILEKQAKLSNTVYFFTDRRIITKYTLGESVCYEEISYEKIKSVSHSGGILCLINNLRNITLSTSSEKVKLFDVEGWEDIVSLIKDKTIF